MERRSQDGLEELPDGSLRTPDGTVYRRTPQRVTRRIGRELIDDGAAVVTNLYPDGFSYLVGEAASHAWNGIEPQLVTGRRPPVRDTQWIGHVWRTDDGRPLLRFEGEH
ncbi:hypothetical protein [Cellulosimicrobium sp. NPDC057127]|uniref:hypothetical protein n=1 Tax=Cellulosimicrobium sp. NPDC057127 TaxID=3346026 RepID=UPI00363E8F45